MSQIEFSRKLIKGRIAEVVFEQMFRKENKYTVIPFGYEHTVPTLAQYQHLAMVQRVMENIKDAPDFVLISDDRKEVYLVEVKYRKSLKFEEIKAGCEKLLVRWDPSWLFLATPEGFFFAPCRTIVKNGSISSLAPTWVNENLQKEYLNLLNEFENDRSKK